eukprot:g14207.t1
MTPITQPTATTTTTTATAMRSVQHDSPTGEREESDYKRGKAHQRKCLPFVPTERLSKIKDVCLPLLSDFSFKNFHADRN